MDTIKIFRTSYAYGNKEIMLMTARSLRSLKEQRKVVLDQIRYKNELKLYRYQLEKGYPSIVSALIPLIIANESLEKAVEESFQVYSFIRRTLTRRNKVGITMLCHFLFNLGNFESEFSSFTMTGNSKEEEIDFQKAKIDIILGKNNITGLIVAYLEENEEGPNQELLDKIRESEPVEINDLTYKAMENYFVRICNFETSAPQITADFDIRNIVKTEENSQGTDPFIGTFLMKEKVNGIIRLQCKRGELNLDLADYIGKS